MTAAHCIGDGHLAPASHLSSATVPLSPNAILLTHVYGVCYAGGEQLFLFRLLSYAFANVSAGACVAKLRFSTWALLLVAYPKLRSAGT